MKRYLKYIQFALLIFVVISCSNTQEPFSFIQICDPQLGMGSIIIFQYILIVLMRRKAIPIFLLKKESPYWKPLVRTMLGHICPVINMKLLSITTRGFNC